MTAPGTPAPRTAALRAARAKDSHDKRQRALRAVEALEAAGSPVSFAAVAKTAGVSTWLVYAQGVREHVDAARRSQADRRSTPASPRAQRGPEATPASLRADLAAARDEIRRLRHDRDALHKRFRLHLGAEIDGADRPALIARVAELEAINRLLVAERDARAGEADAARAQIAELEDDLTAARESLRRVIRSENRGS